MSEWPPRLVNAWVVVFCPKCGKKEAQPKGKERNPCFDCYVGNNGSHKDWE